jgi:outer membrane protein TolC
VDPSPDATVVGIGLSASIAVGSVVEADADVSITGIALEIAQGQAELDAVTFAVLTGQELEIALNSVVAGASVEVSPTGIELTITTGSINIQAWQIVNTGSDVNWNIIDTAA